MCCNTAISMRAKYALVNTNTILHYFVGYHRHTFKKIFGLFRPLIAVYNFYMGGTRYGVGGWNYGYLL